jgi:hypothetical protein
VKRTTDEQLEQAIHDSAPDRQYPWLAKPEVIHAALLEYQEIRRRLNRLKRRALKTT